MRIDPIVESNNEKNKHRNGETRTVLIVQGSVITLLWTKNSTLHGAGHLGTHVLTDGWH